MRAHGSCLQHSSADCAMSGYRHAATWRSASTVKATGSTSVLRHGDIEVIGRIVMTQTRVLVTLGVGILVLALAAVMSARRLRWSRARIACAGLAGTSFALVPATTLARGDAMIAWGRSCLIQPGLSLGTPEALLTVTALGTCQTSDVVRNVAGATIACGVAALLLRMCARPIVSENARRAPVTPTP